MTFLIEIQIAFIKIITKIILIFLAIINTSSNIIGLDTPLYCVDSLIPGLSVTGPKLEDSDAKFVDTIRTTLLSGLFFQEQGHADFHVGCNGCLCSMILLYDNTFIYY